MKKEFLKWAIILVSSLMITGLAMRILAVKGISVSDSMLLRGLSCLGLTIIFARRRRLSLRPKSMRTQVIRAGIAGLALSFFSLSYLWLSASAVAVLSNIDVPLLAVLGPLIGIRSSRRTRVLSALTISFLVFYISSIESEGQLVWGLTSLLFGTFLLCFGYVFIKKTMNDENEAITILVPSIAIIAFALAEILVAGASIQAWTPLLVCLGFVSGLGMFGAYIATMRLYKITDIVSAEFPTLISAIVIQPIEAVFLGEKLKATYILSSLGFVVMTYFIMKMQNLEVVEPTRAVQTE